MRIGIMAYGSLAWRTANELSPYISAKHHGIKMPFNIEYASMKAECANSPVLTTVSFGGSTEKGVILEMKRGTKNYDAMNLLWRYETGNSGSEECLIGCGNDSDVVIKTIAPYSDFDILIYAEHKHNIKRLNAETLASLAIESAKNLKVAEAGMDGISYLMKINTLLRISTALSKEYEKKILEMTGTKYLHSAYEKVTGQKFAFFR